MRTPKATLGVSGRQEKLPTLELNALKRLNEDEPHPREIPSKPSVYPGECTSLDELIYLICARYSKCSAPLLPQYCV